jgi:hypothetical protein
LHACFRCQLCLLACYMLFNAAFFARPSVVRRGEGEGSRLRTALVPSSLHSKLSCCGSNSL